MKFLGLCTEIFCGRYAQTGTMQDGRMNIHKNQLFLFTSCSCSISACQTWPEVGMLSEIAWPEAGMLSESIMAIGGNIK